jgi:hypothetical protein
MNLFAMTPRVWKDGAIRIVVRNANTFSHGARTMESEDHKLSDDRPGIMGSSLRMEGHEIGKFGNF